MADDGNKICLDATAGKEKIEIKDQYGNKVVLNAAYKRIELKSPTHNTKLELGNTSKGENYGVYIYSDAEYYLDVKNKYNKKIKGHSETKVDGHYRTTVDGHYRTMVGGYYSTLVGGFYTTVVGGAYTTVAGGFYTNLALVGKTEVCLGAKAQVTLGFKLTVEAGWKYEIGKMKKIGKGKDEQKIVEEKLETLAREVQTLGMDIKMQALKQLKLDAPLINLNCGAFKVKP